MVVVGGGITGLSAAFELSRQGLEPVVIEADSRLGGKILTTPFAGVALDAGADAFLARVPWASKLCEELGVGQDLVAPAATGAYLFANGALRRIPERLMLGIPTDLDALRNSGLISAAGIARAALDLDRPDDRPATDESIGSLIRRRLGPELLDKLIDPLLSGIFAGDTDLLSVAAAAPQIATAAAHGSLIAGARTLLPAPQNGPLLPVFLTLPGGLGRLIDLLALHIGAGRIRTGCSAVGLQRHGNRWSVALDGGDVIEADHVLITTPAPIAARLIGDHCPTARDLLGALEYSSVVLASLAWPATSIARPLDGSGFLVPRSEGLLMTACSWSSSKFAHLGGDGIARLRVSAGRWGDDRIAALDDAALTAQLRRDLATTMGIEATPQEVRISRWPACLAQYRPGHLDRLDALEAALAGEAPGVTATGAAFRGVGLPACIYQGRRAGEQIAAASSA